VSLMRNPNVFNHNVETVPDSTNRFARSNLSAFVAGIEMGQGNESCSTHKSGFMLGLGETWDEISGGYARFARP